MNRTFARIPLPVKLMLIGIIPLIFLLYFSYQIITERTDRIRHTEQLLESIDHTPYIVRAMNELQRERWLSLPYLVNGNESPVEKELLLQRAKVNNILEGLDQYLGRRDPGYKVYTMIDLLDEERSRIDARSISYVEMQEYFANMVLRLMSYMPSSDDITFLQSIRKDVTGQRLIAENYVYLSLLRGNMYYFLSKGQPSPEDLARFKTFTKLFEATTSKFLQEAPRDAANLYRSIMQTDVMIRTTRLIENMAATGSISQENIDANRWVSLSSTSVEMMQKLQGQMLQTLRIKTNIIYEQEKLDRNRLFLVIGIIVLFVVFIVFLTIKTITNSLFNLKAAAERIAKGETGLQLRPASRDVIGSLTNSISVIDHVNQKMAEAADLIGRGDFNTDIRPRSQNDVLGTAILNMKESLEKFTSENKEKVWIQTGIARINDRMRGEKDLITLTRDILSGITDYLDIQLGLFYSFEKNMLVYQSGYGVTDPESLKLIIPLGETLMGEAALKKHIIHLPHVPEEYITITSASGGAKPRHVLIFPLVHNGELQGVIEIASLSPFTEAMQKMIGQISDHIAVAVQTAKNRTRLQQLLEETQSQSEELQAQHNELENVNAELEAQAQKLQASEEELRVQQEELLQANKELEERAQMLEEKNEVIVERNLEIQKKAEELALSTRYKSEFLANMSHELRTPLNSILLLSRLLSENSTKNLDEEQVEYARVINNSGQGLLALIDEILDLSKIEAGKMTLEYHDVNITGIVKDMTSVFAPMAKDKNIELKVDVHDNVPQSISTDKMRLEQVLRNLLSNALKFTPRGSITLEIYTPPGKEGILAFAVKDTGIGIPKEKQQVVFEAFQQADGSTRRKFGGTGLGLSISREIARMLGGEIKLESEPGKGSEFTLYVPVQKPEAPPAIKTAITGQDSGRRETGSAEAPKAPEKEKFIVEEIPKEIDDDRESITANDKVILIVEDDTGFARALVHFAHEQGYKAVVAVQGDQGVALARKYKPLGILLDIQLPVKDGWQVMNELKQDTATRHIPVHMMSSLEVKKESLSRGAIDFINKPVAYEQMHEVFRRLEQVRENKNKKVLIIEENPKHAEALSFFLDNHKVRSEITDSIEGGMEALRKKEVDCVILDMGIPDQKGYKTLEEIKKDPAFEHIPIIIFTGKHLSKAEEERIRKYTDSIIVKTAHSYKRMLDEVALFLHLVEENLEKQPGRVINKQHALDQVLENKNVLIVDDDVRNIFSLAKALESHKMQVFSATDGKEALKTLEENPKIEVVLMDMMMPGMDGYEATAQIRKHPRFNKLPVIAVTAKAMTGDREKCIEAGASDYISKPVDIDQLLSLLRVWLYQR